MPAYIDAPTQYTHTHTGLTKLAKHVVHAHNARRTPPEGPCWPWHFPPWQLAILATAAFLENGVVPCAFVEMLYAAEASTCRAEGIEANSQTCV